MRPGADHDYMICGSTIIFNIGAVPQPGDNIVADYWTTTPHPRVEEDSAALDPMGAGRHDPR